MLERFLPLSGRGVKRAKSVQFMFALFLLSILCDSPSCYEREGLISVFCQYIPQRSRQFLGNSHGMIVDHMLEQSGQTLMEVKARTCSLGAERCHGHKTWVQCVSMVI